MGRKTPGRICTKFCTGGDIQHVITDANFGDDRLSHFCMVRGQILGFSIGFRRHPYNTLTLPCECVILFSSLSLDPIGPLPVEPYGGLVTKVKNIYIIKAAG